MVGLAFIAFNVATAGAQISSTGAPGTAPMGAPGMTGGPGEHHDGPQGNHNPAGAPGMPPMGDHSGMPPMGANSGQ